MYNILAEGMTDAARSTLLEHLKRLKPGLVVVIDRLSYAIAIKQALPLTTVVFRRYHPSNAGGDDNIHLKLSPQQWLESYGDVSPIHGLHLYCNNEPSRERATFIHAEQCARLAVNAGHRIAVLNFSVGVPEPSDWETPESLALLRFAGENPTKVLICVHEYAASFSGMEWGLPYDPAQWPSLVGGASWLVSRYRNIFKACDKHGLKRPRIGVTEASFDYIHAAASYQDGLPHTNGLIGALWANIEAWNRHKPVRFDWPQYMVEQLHWMWRAVFATDPEVVGVANFCWGAFQGTRWELYDISRVPNIIPLMEAKSWSKMATNPPTPIIPTHFVSAVAPVASNVRDDTTTKAAIVRVLSTAGELAKYNNSRAMGDGYVWDNYTFLDGKSGWVRTDVRKQVQLKPVTLNVPYKKQFGDSTNDDRNNDCAAACIAMLLGFEGIEKTVDEVTAVINRPEGTVHFKYLTPAIHTLGFKSEVRQGTQLTDILASLNAGKPMMVLVNYEHLRSDAKYRYGHFVVPIGYWFESQTLMILAHDPYDKASVVYAAARFAKAIGEMEGTSNSAFQSLFFTGQVTPPPPTPEDDSPVLFHVENLLVKARNEIDEAITAIRELRPNIDL